MRTFRNERAFTLAEVIVCIAVVGLVGAIVFPALGCGGGGSGNVSGGWAASQTPGQVLQAQCLSNMQQIARGLQAYMADYDQHEPGGLNGYGGGSGWAGQVYPFVKSTSVFVCPNDTGDTVTGGGGVPAGPWRASSYGINSNAVLPNPTNQSCSANGVGEPLSAFTAPAKTVMLFEVTNCTAYNVDTETQPAPVGTAGNCGGSASGNGLGGAYDPDGYIASASPSSIAGNSQMAQFATGLYNGATPAGSFFSVTGRHQNGANYILADGHAAWFLPSAVTPGTNAASAKGEQVLESASTSNTQLNTPAAGTAGTEADGKTMPSATYSII